MALVGLLGFLAALPGVWIRATYGAQLSGDEPHYLLTAVSLAEDGDLNLADEFAEEAYRPFHEIRLRPQGASLGDDPIVAPHDPLLPALLALPWRLAGWEGAKATLALVNGALGALLVWTGVRRFDIQTGIAAAVSALFVGSAPLAAYGTQIYPELPAALALLGGVAAGLGVPRIRAAIGVVVAVTALPWLAIKYVPVAAALAAYVLVRWWRSGQRRLVVGSMIALAGAGAAYVGAHLAWYGGVTSYATSDFFAERGGQFSVVGSSPDVLGRSRRLVGLLADRQFGLAAWQPAYLVAVPAVAALSRVRPPGWLGLALPLAAGWLTATFVALTMHGWWFPGRQVVVVLPLAVLAVAWLAGRARPWLVTTLAAGALGAVTWGWLVVEGLQAEVTLIVDFASTSNPLHQAWEMLLPNYLRVTATTWILHAVWIVVAVGLALVGWRGVQPPSAPRRHTAEVRDVTTG